MKRDDYVKNTAALVMAQLVHKSAHDQAITEKLGIWDDLHQLANMSCECAEELADMFCWEGEE